ncbi:MAG: YceI family protein [Anaerolineales bacterium]
MARTLARFFYGLLLAGAVAACAGPTATPALTLTPGRSALPPTRVPSGGATPGATYTPSGSPMPAGQLRLEFVPAGTQARYRVGVQILNQTDPSEASGSTPAIRGTMVIRADGTVVSESSKITVDLTGLKSDNAPMDQYVQSLVLQTRTYPTAVFVPSQTIGLESPPPTSGSMNFQIVGSLTIHGVTRPASWNVLATAGDGSQLIGTASTSFAFEDFKIPQPRVPTVVSMENKITLEMQFQMHIAN